MAEEAARSRLGRGLAALIGDVGEETAAVERVRGQRRVPVEFLRQGDFTAARVVRGAPSVDPWRLELQGPDGEYVSLAFAVEEAARVALDLLETRAVMHHATDDEGRPLVSSSEEFEEAKRRHDETERLLALGDGEGAEPVQ